VLAQRQFAGGAEALDHIVVDGDFFLGAAEVARLTPLLKSALATCSRSGSSLAVPKRSTTSS